MKHRNRRKRFPLWLLFLALTVLVLALLYWREIRPVYIKSGSMEPALPVGSLCLVDTKVKGAEYKRGDIIVFTSGNMQIAHRLIGTTKYGFRTKGDANGSPDPGFIPLKNVKGKIIVTLPYMGYAVFLCKLSAVTVLLCASALTIISRPGFGQRKENFKNGK